RQVVDDGDRADVQGDLDGLAAVAALLGGGELLLLERGVGAGELHGTREELLAARAGAGGVVREDDVRGHLVEPGDPALHGLALRGRTRAGQVPAELLALRLATARGAGRGRRRALGVGAARRQGQGECTDEDRGTRA